MRVSTCVRSTRPEPRPGWATFTWWVSNCWSPAPQLSAKLALPSHFTNANHIKLKDRLNQSTRPLSP